MKRILSLALICVILACSLAVPAAASEVVETTYTYTPLPGFYMFYQGTSNEFGGAVSTSGTSFAHTLSSITDTTNTHFKIKLNADTAGQYDYISFVVFLDTDNIDSVAGYLENASTSIATSCEYSVVAASELSGKVGAYAVTVLVDCSGFTGDVNVEISGHLGKSTNDFLVMITGYTASGYTGVLVDYWDDTQELLRQILAELEESNGFLSSIKTTLEGFKTDAVYWIQEIYSAIQLNALTLWGKLDDLKASVDSFWDDTVYWFEETYAAIQLGFLNVQNSIETWAQNIIATIKGEHYTQDDEFAENAETVVQENQEIIDQITDNTPTIPLDDLDPLSSLDYYLDGRQFDAAPVLALFFDGTFGILIGLSLTFALLGYALYGKR